MVGDYTNFGKYLVYTYDPADPTGGTVNTCAATDPIADVPMKRGRRGYELDDSVKLKDGRILITGGIRTDNISSVGDNISVIYDPGNDAVDNCTITATGPMNIPRTSAVTVAMNSGDVLIVCGRNNANTLIAASEIYSISGNIWTQTGSVNTPREGFASTLLPNGKIAIFGGKNFSGAVLDTIEVYDPSTELWTVAGTMLHARTSFRAIVLANGKVLLCGGTDASGIAVAEAELFTP